MANTSEDSAIKRVTIEDLENDWLDACWAMLIKAYDEGEVDASDLPQPMMDSIEQRGVDAWMAEIYPVRIAGERVEYCGHDVNKLLDEAEFRARLLICARDHGIKEAMLMKLRHGGAQ